MDWDWDRDREDSEPNPQPQGSLSTTPLDPVRAPAIDQPPFGFTHSEAATTTYASSMAGQDDGDDAATRASVYTFTSTDASEYRRQHEGRMFNVLNDAYLLPSDEDEWARLNKQHIAFILTIGGLYPCPDEVKALLAPDAGPRKRILDLGCGSGAWAISMAKEFPHAEVIGVDLAPTPVEAETLPSNCFFEVDDVNLGLAHYADSFDFIHARLIVGGIANFRKTLDDVASCLRPGGLMLIHDADYTWVREDREDYAPAKFGKDKEGSWLAWMPFEVGRAFKASGRSDMDGMHKILSRGLWDTPLLDPKTCRRADLYLPTAPFAQLDASQVELNQRLRSCGMLFRQDCVGGASGAGPLWKRIGYTDDEVKEHFDGICKELEDMSYPIWARFFLNWGRRRAGPGQDASPLPKRPKNGSDDAPAMKPYPFMTVFDDPEKARANADEWDRKKAAMIIPPLPNQR